MSSFEVTEPLGFPSVKPAAQPRVLSLEQFRRKYSSREDGYKYEYNDGVIEKTEDKMRIKQYHVVDNLTRFFAKTTAYSNGAALGSEVEQITLPNKMRKPDLLFITREKIKTEDETVSPFVIEIISGSDNINRVNRKLDEYFAAGVKVVWHVFPEDERVYVYTSPLLVTICQGEIVCSAAPVLPDFDLPAKEIFVK